MVAMEKFAKFGRKLEGSQACRRDVDPFRRVPPCGYGLLLPKLRVTSHESQVTNHPPTPKRYGGQALHSQSPGGQALHSQSPGGQASDDAFQVDTPRHLVRLLSH